MVRRGSAASVLAAASVLTAVALGGCTSSPTGPESDPDAAVLVWADATRQPGVQAFIDAHPEMNVKVELQPVDFLTKIQLFNQGGSGWPDVMFVATTNPIAMLSAPNFDYAQPLDGLVSGDVLEGFGNSNDICKVDGKLMCLRNDIAPTVLWYNQKLMDEFGYSVPATWEEYAELGATVAAEHPGYVLGAIGDAFAYYGYFQSAGCPMQEVVAPNTVHIDLTDPACTQMAEILDSMVADKSVLTTGLFDPDTIKAAQEGKMLMMPGASWLGKAVFEPASAYGFPSGEWAAAPSPTLGSEENSSGSAGGGIWVVSKHAENMDGAVKVVEWMTTDLDLQGSGPTFPAYAPAADAWRQSLATSDFFAEDPYEVMAAQAILVNPVNNFATRFEPADVFPAEYATALKAGLTITSALPAMQAHLENLATSTGYKLG